MAIYNVIVVFDVATAETTTTMTVLLFLVLASSVAHRESKQIEEKIREPKTNWEKTNLENKNKKINEHSPIIYDIDFYMMHNNYNNDPYNKQKGENSIRTRFGFTHT